MKALLIAPFLGFACLMTAQTYVAESMACYLFSVLVLVLGSALCKATNWMTDEEKDDAAD